MSRYYSECIKWDIYTFQAQTIILHQQNDKLHIIYSPYITLNLRRKLVFSHASTVNVESKN